MKANKIANNHRIPSVHHIVSRYNNKKKRSNFKWKWVQNNNAAKLRSACWGAIKLCVRCKWDGKRGMRWFRLPNKYHTSSSRAFKTMCTITATATSSRNALRIHLTQTFATELEQFLKTIYTCQTIRWQTKSMLCNKVQLFHHFPLNCVVESTEIVPSAWRNISLENISVFLRKYWLCQYLLNNSC